MANDKEILKNHKKVIIHVEKNTWATLDVIELMALARADEREKTKLTEQVADLQGVIACFRDKEKNWLEVARETVRLREALEKIKNYQFKKDVLKVGAGVVISDGFVDCKEIAKKALENRGSADGIGCEGWVMRCRKCKHNILTLHNFCSWPRY
jgi:hypothetical protein